MLFGVAFAVLFALAGANPQWNIPQIPGLPGIPQIPGIPGIPQIPGFPKLPQIPQIPGMPNFNDFSNVDDEVNDDDVELSTPVFPEEARSSPLAARIVAGFPAQVGQFPHQARMVVRVSATSSSVCGGSIISETVILTAAHCTLNHQTFEMGFGSVDFNNPAVTITTNRKVEHQGYNPSNLNNDISLLILPSRLQYTRNIQPIALPSRSQVGTSFADVKATVSGHGRTSDSSSISTRLNWVNVRVIQNSECARHYGTNIIRDFSICTVGWENARQQTCQGDSGGPLIAYDNGLGQNIQIGVVSFVSGRGCEAQVPAGFVRTSSYLDWIQQNGGPRPR